MIVRHVKGLDLSILARSDRVLLNQDHEGQTGEQETSEYATAVPYFDMASMGIYETITTDQK